MVEIKFCGLTRPEDARDAVAEGAAYVGVVFAGGPRQQDDRSAARIFAAVPAGTRKVGVFAAADPHEIAVRAAALGLYAIQWHGDPVGADVAALRAVWRGQIWAVLRVSGVELPAYSAELFATADAVLLDAKVDGALGGTGVALDWSALARSLTAVRSSGSARLVLAGGLRAENVAAAIRAVSPDIVDVSSGIESTVGIKDRARMRAFREAVRSAEDVQ